MVIRSLVRPERYQLLKLFINRIKICQKTETNLIRIFFKKFVKISPKIDKLVLLKYSFIICKLCCSSLYYKEKN